MSKAQLRKELAGFTAPQLRELILEIYDARREAKEYLEFYLNPDVDKLIERHSEVVNKEFNRMKRRTLTPRWSKLRENMKIFASYKPGADRVLNFMLFNLNVACFNLRYVNVAPTVLTGTERLVTDILKFADSAGLVDSALPAMVEIIDSIPTNYHHSATAASELKYTLESYKPKLK